MTELGEFIKHQKELKELDVQVIGVSVDPPDKAKFAADKLGATFPILPDPDRKVMKLYGIESPIYNGKDGLPLNTPTLVFIDHQGIIQWIHQAPYYRTRAPVLDTIQHARSLER